MRGKRRNALVKRWKPSRQIFFLSQWNSYGDICSEIINNVSFSPFLHIKLSIGLQRKSWAGYLLSEAQKHWLLAPEADFHQMIADGF